MKSIIAYLAANPSAADTIDGIVEVWVHGAATREAVEEAVDHLVAQGTVLRTSLPDGSALFSGSAHLRS
ncbi:MAG TPA: hypothetical protein VFG59_12070 [Anaeromyxobacter sp.]|nr:hypothetical protein [Anaeromyxobacter sp.]